MGLFNRSNNGVTDEQRLLVMGFVVDEDWALPEVARRCGSVSAAQVIVRELLDHKLIEFYQRSPKGGRDPIAQAEQLALVDDAGAWAREASTDHAYVIVVATDKGWRWHQKHWQPDG